MRLTVLTENTAGGKFLAEHGLSYLIEIDEEKILFDAGHSNVFLQNAKQLGINIQTEVKKVVLSHGHWDHGNGLEHLNGQTLITHPASFAKRYRKSDHSPVGLSISKQQLENSFKLNETKSPFQISKNLFFLGEIPRTNDFESQTTPFELEDGSDDFIMDDSALVAIQDNRLIIITGCSHSGICNICEQAKLVTGVSAINVVIGGFHLKFQNKQTKQTIAYFKQNNIDTLLPSHCTDLPALSLFHKEFKIQQVKTGMVFDF